MNTLFELYKQACRCLAGEASVDETISEACDILEHVVIFQELHAECVLHINRRDTVSLESWIAEGEAVIEDISGTLGEYFA